MKCSTLLFMLSSVRSLSSGLMVAYKKTTKRSPPRLLSTGASSDVVKQFDHHPDVRMDPPEYDPSKVYFPIYYNDVYEVILPKGHRFPMEKYRRVRALVQQALGEAAPFCVSPLSSWEELITTHTPEYVQRFLIGNQTKAEVRNVGFPWSPQGVKRALSSTGGTIAAACAVCQALYEQKSHPVWSAQVAGGTHHAFADRGEGFCVFSDIAVAANVVRQRFPDRIKRILIIDLDVHQGNGNAVLFQGRQDVVTFSMHCESNFFSKKEQSDLDVVLPQDCNDETYLTTLRHWLKQISTQGGAFDLVFYQAGVDVLEHDRLGRMSLTADGVTQRNELVFRFCWDHQLPLVITMGGGYPRNDDWSPILQSHAGVYIQAYEYLEKLQD